MKFSIDPRLQKDCFVLGRSTFCHVLLMNNAAVPWFILVPETDALEIYDLSTAQQTDLWAEVRKIAEFVRSEYPVDKLNVAAIGNIVAQLHVHVVGRRHDDYCWPDVVWGRPAPEQYAESVALELRAKLASHVQGFVRART